MGEMGEGRFVGEKEVEGEGMKFVRRDVYL